MKGDITVESCHTRQKQVLQGSARVVLLAIGSNTILMSSKLIAAIMTGSSSMLSEALHSLADVGNELLLLWGIRRSMKDPDVQHPYGFSRERYAWALVSGVGIFFLGCGVSLYHGISGMLYPSAIVDPHIAYAVLGASLFFEGGTMMAALNQVRKSAAQTQVSLKEYILRGADPTAVQVLLEDTAAVAGVLIAGTSLSLSIFTGNPIYDAAGSVGIGLLLGNVAVFLVKRNVSLLVETSMDPRRMKEVVDILQSDPVVKTVHDVKSTSLGPEWARFKAEVQFDGGEVTRRRLESLPSEYLARELVKAQGLTSEKELKEFLIAHGEAGIVSLAREVDRVESRIQEKVPEVKHCDLEIL